MASRASGLSDLTPTQGSQDAALGGVGGERAGWKGTPSSWLQCGRDQRAQDLRTEVVQPVWTTRGLHEGWSLKAGVSEAMGTAESEPVSSGVPGNISRVYLLKNLGDFFKGETFHL
ncbi:uncharacterized protein LOC144234201 [Crocuta crocuta]